MRTVFLVPRRSDAAHGGHRDQLWEWCRRRWETLCPDIDIVEGHHEVGPFNRAAAINTAAELADADGRWDVAVVLDSDVFVPIPNVRKAIKSAAAGKVTWAHRRWRGISESDTARLIKDPDGFGPVPAQGRDMDLIVEKTTPISWSCCVAIPRATFDDMGGFDERFSGWGFEDGAWSALARGLYAWDRIEGDIYHWWHPRSDERVILGLPGSTASNDYVRNALLGRRYMIAAIRDHAAGDQPGEERLSAELVGIHVRNLINDDRRFLLLASQRHMAEVDWRTWWPTLEELRDGAKTFRVEAARPTVTLVVHTGGEPANWDERSSYLQRSLASLSEMVSGPIIQRVIYSDWGEDRATELQAIGEPFGFYVVGPKEHQGYTGSMRAMWIYLARRAKGTLIFRVEDDFTYDRAVDLDAMSATLREHPYLAQLALLRGPAYPREFELGGILGWPEASFEQVGLDGTQHLEHRNFWTNNPALFRRSLALTPWPNGHSSERLFGDALLRDEATRFGLWGDGSNWISHIGEVRAGAAY
ncbi:MAG: hypothetical protein ABIU97_00620 [Dehalococcoidia bacterium]